MIDLLELPVGASARLESYQTDNSFTERLREMGFTVGTEFTLVRRAPLGGPCEIRFGQSRVALRPPNDVRIRVSQV